MNIEQIVEFLSSIYGYPTHKVLEAIPRLKEFVREQGAPLQLTMNCSRASQLIRILSSTGGGDKRTIHRQVKRWMKNCVEISGAGAYPAWATEGLST